MAFPGQVGDIQRGYLILPKLTEPAGGGSELGWADASAPASVPLPSVRVCEVFLPWKPPSMILPSMKTPSAQSTSRRISLPKTLSSWKDRCVVEVTGGMWMDGMPDG